MIYNVRIDEANWARCGCCGHKLFEVVSRTGDIKIKCHSCKNINITRRRECSTCKWFADGICMNDASIMFLKTKEDRTACEAWEMGNKRR